jgi:hypothetical protein
MKAFAILSREIRDFLAVFKAILAATSIVSVDVASHRAATSADFAVVVERLTAIIASIKDARTLARWMRNTAPQKDVEQRLRLTCHIVGMLVTFESPAVVQAWLIGLNPELQDASPIKLLRDGAVETDGKRVLDAARGFVARPD